jgi:membrane-bound metal-dependent hydrolase YbcI (DUF457 family)
MFVGHFAVGFASKRLAPRTSLGWLMVAPLFLDLLWPIFLLLGLEHVRITPNPNPFLTLEFTSYPWSHSLVMTLVWALAFALVYRWRTGDGVAALVLAAGVTSHWVLDWVTHRPDLPWLPGVAARAGLGLWNSPIATMIVEGAMFAAGVAIYLRMTRAKDRVGSIATWAFIVTLVALYFANLSGPPPPSERVLGIVGQIGWVFAAWIFWFDAHREVRIAPAVVAEGARP